MYETQSSRLELIPLYCNATLLRWVDPAAAKRNQHLRIVTNKRGRPLRAMLRTDSPWIESRIATGAGSRYGEAILEILDCGEVWALDLRRSRGEAA